MAKTIKEIADELGVSKTAVSKQIANLGLRSSLRKNGNQFAIENQQEKLIKMAFRKNKQRERIWLAMSNRKPNRKPQTPTNRKPKTMKFAIWFAFYRLLLIRCKNSCQ